MAAAQGKVIITCAITGAIHTPTMSPHLPITADEARTMLKLKGGNNVGF